MNEMTAGISTERAAAKAPIWAWVIGTFFGTGFGRPGPGTWACVGTTLLWAAVGTMASGTQLVWIAIGLAVIGTLIGARAATLVSRALGRKDPSQIVIDEFAGQIIAFIAAPVNWRCLLAGLILFRVFDIAKPLPLRRLEKLPEGWGIMLDDVGAGLYALAAMQVLLYFNVLK